MGLLEKKLSSAQIIILGFAAVILLGRKRLEKGRADADA